MLHDNEYLNIFYKYIYLFLFKSCEKALPGNNNEEA